jgi:hypothetical protein
MGTLKAVSDGDFTCATGGNASTHSVTGTVITAASLNPATIWEPTGYSSGTPSSTESVEFSEFKDELALFRIDLTKRITEISNRIGYLNGKDVADGGLDDSSQKSAGHDTAGGGFAGYSFNSGSGYANTIYAHCNFLAGKKVDLLAKILKAVESVTDIYNQIKSKRAEYYEYNQG